jgi:hypothetical protein
MAQNSSNMQRYTMKGLVHLCTVPTTATTKQETTYINFLCIFPEFIYAPKIKYEDIFSFLPFYTKGKNTTVFVQFVLP